MPYDRTIQDRSKPPRYIGRDVRRDHFIAWHTVAGWVVVLAVVAAAMTSLHNYGR